VNERATEHASAAEPHRRLEFRYKEDCRCIYLNRLPAVMKHRTEKDAFTTGCKMKKMVV
jgi:hypothetical protein